LGDFLMDDECRVAFANLAKPGNVGLPKRRQPNLQTRHRLQEPARARHHFPSRRLGPGRRTAIVSNNGVNVAETRYLWCGEELCQARNASDTVIRRY
jgi:hypothetical protein